MIYVSCCIKMSIAKMKYRHGYINPYNPGDQDQPTTHNISDDATAKPCF